MQAAAGSSSSNSRRRSYNEGLVVEDEDDDDKLDKLAESSSSSAPVTRRLSTTSTSHDAARRMSISNGIVAADKGKSRMEEKDCHDDDDEQQEDQQMNAESELEYDTDDDESLHCAICLSVIDDRTVVQPCCHGELRSDASKPSDTLLTNTTSFQTPIASFASSPGQNSRDGVHYAWQILSFSYTTYAARRISRRSASLDSYFLTDSSSHLVSL